MSQDETARARSWSDEEARLRRAICEIGKLCYSRFYIVGADGNISARMNDGTVLITPAGAMKGFLEPHHIAHIDMRGNVVDGGPSASTEKGIHLTAYEVRPEMRAVCHAHPPHAVAMTIAGIDMQAPFIPEIIVTIGGIPTANFGTPGTPELADSIRNILKCSDTVVMTNHGSVTLGTNLMDAYKKLDMVEHTAKILYYAHSVGHAKPLNAEYVQKLLATRGLLGIKTVNTLENECGVRKQD
ncbi:MAG: class II aldolase/adducin family protein [Planctomycetes bacterium]|nr:class II aldolase/adducin family protein [Planctomycetota bacterium]